MKKQFQRGTVLLLVMTLLLGGSPLTALASTSSYAAIVEDFMQLEEYGSSTQGALYDLDGDGNDELMFLHTAPIGNSGHPSFMFSIYSRRNGIPIGASVDTMISEMAGKAHGWAGVFYKQGQDYFVTYLKNGDGPDFTVEIWSYYSLKNYSLSKKEVACITRRGKGSEWSIDDVSVPSSEASAYVNSFTKLRTEDFPNSSSSNLTSVLREARADDTAHKPNPLPTRFLDVPVGAYYVEAVKWAISEDVTSGTSSTTFSPDKPCSRAEALTFMWRAEGKPYVNAIPGFLMADVDSGAYYDMPMRWAFMNEVSVGTGTVGTGANKKFIMSPNQTCTRAQIVTFLWRAAGSPEPYSQQNRFVDVPSNAYYEKAVRWAAEHGITSGTGANHFSPNAPCTRAQIVTFLYRSL